MFAYVYILSNSITPDILKVGYTTRAVSQRVAELNAQTGSMGVFTAEEAFEVPASMAIAIESLAHGYLRHAGQHYAKEYFRASVDECRASILRAMQHTAAVQTLTRLKQTGVAREAAKQSREVEKRIRRIEKCEALYIAFLSETSDTRKRLHTLARAIDDLCVQAESIGLIASLFSVEAKMVSMALQNQRAELRSTYLHYVHLFFEFKKRNSVGRDLLQRRSLRIDEFDVQTIVHRKQRYGLDGLRHFEG